MFIPGVFFLLLCMYFISIIHVFLPIYSPRAFVSTYSVLVFVDAILYRWRYHTHAQD